MYQFSTGTSRWLTLVFVSTIIFSIGILYHNAFADTVAATVHTNGAWGIATNPNTDMTYVANGNNNTSCAACQSYHIQVINDKTDGIVASVEPASVPSGSYACYTYAVAVNPVTNMIYTNNNACVYWPMSSAPTWIPQTVSVINGTNNHVIAIVTISTINISSEPPQPIAVNPTTKMIYALANLRTSQSTPSYLAVINGTTNQVTSNIALPDNQASDIAINSQTNTIYVLDGNVIFVIDGKTDSVLKNFSWGKSSNEGLGFNPSTNRIYVSNSDGSVSVIDGSTNQVVATVSGTAYGFVGINPTTNKVYVSSPDLQFVCNCLPNMNSNSHVVSVIDGTTNTLLTPVQAGLNPYGIGVNTATNKIYVGNSGSSTVSVINGSTSSSSSTPAPTTTTLTSSSNPSTVGQSVTFTATVSPSTATGTVQFSIDGTPAGSPITLSGSQASYSTSSLSVGTHSITATYSGDVNDASSTSATLTQTVNKAVTTTTVTPNPSFQPLLSTKTYHVTVTDGSSSPTTPTGSVSWSDGGAGGIFSSASCTLVSASSSSSTCSIVYTAPSTTGQVTLTATYSGDGSHSTSSGIAALTITLRHTSTAVIPNPSSVVHGNIIKFNATVSDTSGGTKSAPTGTVSWTASVSGGSFISGTCTLSATSTSKSYCTVTYTAPSTTGSVTITAKYLGNSTHKTSSGNSVLTVT